MSRRRHSNGIYTVQLPTGRYVAYVPSDDARGYGHTRAAAVRTLLEHLAALPLEQQLQRSLAMSTIVRLQTHHWIRLMHLDGREWCKAGFTDMGDAWGWICETVAHEAGCGEDEVGCLEDLEGGGDLATVEGLPLYRICHGLAPQSK